MLYHDIGYLQSIVDRISYWPIEEQALFSDGVCRNHASSSVFCEDQLPKGPIEVTFFNATSVGNLAYMALYCHEDYRDRFKAYYDEALKQTKAISTARYKSNNSLLKRGFICFKAFACRKPVYMASAVIVAAYAVYTLK